MDIQTTLNIPETFTKSEFLLMCSIVNGVRCRPSTFIGNITAGLEYENTSNINEENFLEKLNALEESDIYDLYNMVFEYWNVDANSFLTEDRLKEMGLEFEN